MVWRIERRQRQIMLAIAIAATFGPAVQRCRANPPHGEGVMVPALTASQLEDPLRGQVLLEELNCVACHAANSTLAAASKKAPRLAAVGARVNPSYLEQFIQAPHTIKPGTTMPDVMSHLGVDQRQQAATTITHYLLSLNKARPFDLEAIDAVAAEQGGELFHSVGCAACHAPRNERGEELLTDSSAPLGALEKKYSTRSLAEFLRAPHKIRPSGRMPDLRLSPRDAERIAHYLVRETRIPGHLRYTLLRGRVWEGLEVNVTKEKSGHVQDFDLGSLPEVPGNSALVYEGYLHIDTAGDHTFFLEMNGGQLWLNDAEVANLPASSRRGVKAIQAKAKLTAGWNQLKLIYIHAGQEPKFKFEMEGPGLARQAIGAARLSISRTPIQPFRPFRVDPSLVPDGKRNFAALGCVKCHDDVKDASDPLPALAALAALVATRGCLSDSEVRTPRFHLSAAQTALIRPLLATVEQTELGQSEIINKSLVTFNCIACHERSELGGVSPERNQYFVGSKKELGNQGRIPPPLTLVGAKLPMPWIKEVMLNGQQQRTYLATRMPQFGEANVGHLAPLFEKVDTLEEVTFPEIEDVDQAKRAGHELVGSTGFSCIACHDFNGQKASGPGAMEIIHATQRLKKDWFYLYLLNPARFQPGTIMPAAWPGGHVFKQHILGGDAKRQIESIWVYLEDGTRAKNPVGLSRKSPELRVTDETVICRGRGNAGYRGIAVGYPRRVSLAFDSQEMNLRLLWKGDFATVNDGSFSARGQDRIEFPPGIPFHRLPSLEDNWPYKRQTDYLFPQDHGYQFRGYYLDQQKRPTFMYRYGEIRVEDFFEDLTDEKQNAYFRRTLSFETPREQQMFYFRAAAGKDINQGKATLPDKDLPGKAPSRSSFVADRVTVTITEPFEGIVRDGDPKELLIPLVLPQGRSKFVLEYRW